MSRYYREKTPRNRLAMTGAQGFARQPIDDLAQTLRARGHWTPRASRRGHGEPPCP